MIWTEESAALLARAYRHGTAVGTLCSRIEPALKAHSRVCDVGCGVGALSLSLADRGYHVTALDISRTALLQLKGHESERLMVRCEDAEEHVPEKPYDAMVFCFFGGMEECLRIASRCCTGEVFHISRNYDMHRFSVGRHPVRRGGWREACACLDKLGIPYRSEAFALDMGQPFESLAEARRFFELYSRDEPGMITDAFLQSRLVRTEDAAYPLYLPHMRSSGLVHFHVKDIPSMYADRG